MAKSKKEVPSPEVESLKKTLSEKEIARAVTNSPQLSHDEFQIKDRVFKVVDLEYDDYIDFVALLKPVLVKVAGAERQEPSLPGISLSETNTLQADAILEYCRKELPDLACIVCNSQEKAQALLENREVNPDNLVDGVWLKKNGNPVKLASIVLKQLLQNNMIGDFADFFVQALPILKAIQL